MQKQEQIVALSRDGLSPVEIAAIVKCTPNSVSVVLWKARRKGILSGDAGAPGRPYAVHISQTEKAQLDLAAAERGVPPQVLVSELISTIVRDDLFAAVLDTGGRKAAA